MDLRALSDDIYSRSEAINRYLKALESIVLRFTLYIIDIHCVDIRYR
jgi:hypothetical protein